MGVGGEGRGERERETTIIQRQAFGHEFGSWRGREGRERKKDNNNTKTSPRMRVWGLEGKGGEKERKTTIIQRQAMGHKFGSWC